MNAQEAIERRLKRGFAQRLFAAWQRLEAGAGTQINQTDLTQRLADEGVSVAQSAVSRWRSGESVPGHEHAVGLARVLRVPAGWLIYGEGDPPPGVILPEEPHPRTRGRPVDVPSAARKRSG